MNGASSGDQYVDFVDEEDNVMAELEEEMNRARMRSSGGAGNQSRGAVLPAGAVPSQNGVLSVHAKEFWFPESRNCECCKGFKHGCDCCTGGVDTCTKTDCISTEHTTKVAAELASRTTAGPSVTTSATSTTVTQATPVSSHSTSTPPTAKSGGVLPAGAMPTKNGVLTAHAKEFWFPESRNCDCCKGFKHGCDCCAGGVDTCTKTDCISTEHTQQVAAELSNRVTDTPSAVQPLVIQNPALIASSTPSATPRSQAPFETDVMCKFYQSGSCRFGAACRFKHPDGTGGVGVGTGMGSNVSTPTSGGYGGKVVCQFFLNGNCTYGNTCRNMHVLDQGPVIYAPSYPPNPPYQG